MLDMKILDLMFDLLGFGLVWVPFLSIPLCVPFVMEMFNLAIVCWNCLTFFSFIQGLKTKSLPYVLEETLDFSSRILATISDGLNVCCIRDVHECLRGQGKNVLTCI